MLKTISSSLIWTTIQQFGTQGLNFVVSIILARLLLPSEFGLIALLSVLMALSNAIIDGGLAKSIIRSDSVSQNELSSVFWLNVALAVIMYLALFLSANYVAHFFEQPQLLQILRVYGLVLLIGSFGIIQRAQLTKSMNFKSQTLIAFPSLIAGAIVGITMAFTGWGVWSLVWAAITRSVMGTVQLWIYSKWIPSLSFSFASIKPHFSFGYKLTISAIIDTVFRESYTLVIAKFFNPMQVGFYNRANSLKQLPVSNFSAILGRITFPLFSKVKNDNEQLKRYYKKILQSSAFLIAPTLLVMAVMAEPLFRFLLTEKWLPAVPYFQILCVQGILYPLHAYNLEILNVKGRSDLFLRLEVIKKSVLLISIIISVPYGIYALLISRIIVSIFMVFVNTFYSGKLIGYNIWLQLKDLVSPVGIALLTASFVFFLDRYLVTDSIDLIRLLTSAILSIISLVLLSKLFHSESFSDLQRIAVSMKSSFRNKK